jgi:hypothetical protein
MPKYPEFKSKPIIGLKEEDWGKLSTGQFNRVINMDWESTRAKAVINTDYKAAAAKRDYKAIVDKIDWKSLQEKRIANTNYELRTANTDYKARNSNPNYKASKEKLSKKLSKPIDQFDLQGNFIKTWSSAIQAEKELNYSPGGISACCRGKQKKAFGFIWKFKEINI